MIPTPRLNRHSSIFVCFILVACCLASLAVRNTATLFFNVNRYWGTHAVGTLWFINDSNHNITFLHMILIGHSEIKVTFHDSITVPITFPGFITVPAYAINPGTSGNIAALDLNSPCCAPGIFVKSGAFHGGCDGALFFISGCDGIRIWAANSNDTRLTFQIV